MSFIWLLVVLVIIWYVLTHTKNCPLSYEKVHHNLLGVCFWAPFGVTLLVCIHTICFPKNIIFTKLWQLVLNVRLHRWQDCIICSLSNVSYKFISSHLLFQIYDWVYRFLCGEWFTRANRLLCTTWILRGLKLPKQWTK